MLASEVGTQILHRHMQQEAVISRSDSLHGRDGQLVSLSLDPELH